ncbi:N-6 DNA methylase [Pseudonocardia pini]|uniref:N-6 DNA methylase n=1 Tax=Pseudonocardia pini TaxID=2758030 RepID=UPI0015F08D3C|nr:N-6 DNA methylase [Pseudonocardia pini]
MFTKLRDSVNVSYVGVVSLEERDLVTAAAVARRAGVGRAAVANWRKRYPDFPQPVSDAGSGTLYSWQQVEKWLVGTGKADQLAASGRTSTGTQLLRDAGPGIDRDLSDLTAPEVLARVMASVLPPLDDADDSAEHSPVVLDPACVDRLLLGAVAERFGAQARLAGQVSDSHSESLVNGAVGGVDLRVGRFLEEDRFTDVAGQARAVVCTPPQQKTWPATKLAADPRWRFGLPDPLDPDLAWVQACLAFLSPRGVAVVAVSPVAAVRPSGRHVRDMLVRAGVLSAVIALPAGLTRSGEGATQLWVLEHREPGRGVAMIELSGLGDIRDVPLEYPVWQRLLDGRDPLVSQLVPTIELLDGETPLLPSRYVRRPVEPDPAELAAATERLRALYGDVGRALPQPLGRTGSPLADVVTVAELERSRALTLLPRDAEPRAGDILFRTMNREPVVATGTPDDDRGVAQVLGLDPDRLDAYFFALFVRVDALAAPVGNTLSALTRDDVKRCRVPRLPIAEQRRYGEAYRHLLELGRVATQLATVTKAVVAQTSYGLTTGALDPSAVTRRETMTTETAKNEKRTT